MVLVHGRFRSVPARRLHFHGLPVIIMAVTISVVICIVHHHYLLLIMTIRCRVGHGLSIVVGIGRCPLCSSFDNVGTHLIFKKTTITTSTPFFLLLDALLRCRGNDNERCANKTLEGFRHLLLPCCHHHRY